MSSQPEWWQSFFSGLWLDVQRQARSAEQTRNEAAFIEKLLQLSPQARVLDVPCGEGRLSLELAARGYQVTGVDITVPLLDDARRKAAERQLVVTWEHRDMRDLPWQEEFDGAFCFWGSFGYFDDDGDADFLKAVFRTLKPGGRFLVDIPVTETILAGFRRRDWNHMGDALVLEERWYDHVQSRVNVDWTFVYAGKEDRRSMSIRLYTYRELCRLFEEVGFVNWEGYDTLSQQPFRFGSQRLTLVATKPTNALEMARQRYAEEVCQKAQVRSAAVTRAFSQVPREHYLGPGPWKVLDLEYHATANAEPKHLYHNVLVEIDPARQANNGQPSFLAFLIDALEVQEGEHVVHVGCGTGYYTAILAEVVGPSGCVTAVEIDADLAARARNNLADLQHVQVVHADGGEYDPRPANAIFINAGATHPRPLWLDRLLPGGRLVFPLTVTTRPGSAGYILKVTHNERGYTARFISPTMIFPCIGARDPDADRHLWEAFARGGWESVRSLRRDLHEAASSCWLHGDGFCLSMDEVAP